MDNPRSDEATTGGRLRLSPRRRLVVAAVVLLVLGTIGWVSFGTGDDDHVAAHGGGSSAPPVPTTMELTTPPTASLQLSLNRDGDEVTLTGELPDEAARSEFVSTVKSQWSAARVIDNVMLSPGTRGPELAGLGGLLTAVAGVQDFGFAIHGADLTLTGTAPDIDFASQIQSVAALAFPSLKLTNNLQIPAVGAPPMVVPNQASPSNAPVPPPAANCQVLQADIANLLRTPISFTTGGAELASESRQLVAQVAAKIKACPAAAVTVVGYTDNVGSESLNQQLSAGRAKAVADVLVSDGVSAAKVSSRGAGSANPIASNDTPAGRAQNRRVAITVN